MSALVKVLIQLSGHWDYCQEVEMTREEYAEYSALLDQGGRDYRRAVADLSSMYVELRDIEIDDAQDLDDFRIVGE